MTLLEEINLRIEVYGGREVVARQIEAEWKPKVVSMRKTYTSWKRSEIMILKNRSKIPLTKIAKILNRSYDSVHGKNKAGHF